MKKLQKKTADDLARNIANSESFIFRAEQDLLTCKTENAIAYQKTLIGSMQGHLNWLRAEHAKLLRQQQTVQSKHLIFVY